MGESLSLLDTGLGAASVLASMQVVQLGKSFLLHLCMSLGSLLFDPFGTPFHAYHSYPIIDVARIHLMD
jgi:hypothetical protein